MCVARLRDAVYGPQLPPTTVMAQPAAGAPITVSSRLVTARPAGAGAHGRAGERWRPARHRLCCRPTLCRSDALIEAVVFDFDGLIFDSETHEYETVLELFTEHGAELPLEVWGQCVGREPGFFDPYAYLAERTGGPVDRAALEARRRTAFHARVERSGAIPGVEEALRAAKSLGLRIGLASSSTRGWVEPQLKR